MRTPTTKFGAIADVHLANHRWRGGAAKAGVNARAAAVLAVLERAVKTAADVGCKLLVVCGDLFDHVRPEPQLLARAADIFRCWSELEVVVLVGNHDMVSVALGDHALGPLAAVDNVFVIQRPTVVRRAELELWCVPFRPGPTSAWLLPALVELGAECERRYVGGQARPQRRVLALHAGIADDQTPPYLRGAPDSVAADDLAMMMHAHRIDDALAGNWHDHRAWDYQRTARGGEQHHHIVQVGALVPTGFDNPGLTGYGSLVTVPRTAGWDPNGGTSWSRVELPGPRFLTFTGDHAAGAIEAAAEDAREMGHALYVRWKAAPAILGSAAAQLADAELRLGLAGAEAVPDEKEARAARAEAAVGATAAVRDGLGWERALRSYVDAMPLDEGVDRAGVLQRALGYAGKAGG